MLLNVCLERRARLPIDVSSDLRLGVVPLCLRLSPQTLTAKSRLVIEVVVLGLRIKACVRVDDTGLAHGRLGTSRKLFFPFLLNASLIWGFSHQSQPLPAR